MTVVLVVLGVWFLVALAVALLLGGAIRRAENRHTQDVSRHETDRPTQ